jgi:hypothetical protein
VLGHRVEPAPAAPAGAQARIVAEALARVRAR